MDPITAIIGALPGLFKAGVGISQFFQGKNTLSNLQRPQYEIPPQIGQILALASQQYGAPNVPGQTAATNTIGLNQANAIAAARDSGNLSSLIPQIQAQSNTATNALQAQVEATKSQQLSVLNSAQKEMASAKDREWQINKFAPYADAYNQAREQIGAGQTNVFGGLDSLSTIGMSLMGGRPTSQLGANANYAKMGAAFANVGGTIGAVNAAPYSSQINQNSAQVQNMLDQFLSIINRPR